MYGFRWLVKLSRLFEHSDETAAASAEAGHPPGHGRQSVTSDDAVRARVTDPSKNPNPGAY